MLFQQAANADEFRIGFGHRHFERRLVGFGFDAGDFGDVLRGANPRHHIFALRIDQELAIQLFFAGRRIAGKGHACRRGFAQIAEHHRLHIDSRAPRGRNGVQFAIFDRALVHPRAEHRADGAPQLLFGILRERLAALARHQILVGCDDQLPFIGFQIGVELIGLAVLVLFQNVFEMMVVDVQHDIGEHLDETAVAVIGKAGIAGAFGHRFDRHIIEAEIEHGIHHARHRGARARADRQQQGILGIAENAARQLADLRQCRFDLPFEFGRIGLVMRIIIGADFG